MSNENLELAWLAGIMDGEGTIGLNKVKKKTPKGYVVSPRIAVANTDKLMIDKVCEILKRYGIKHNVSTYKDKNIKSAKLVYKLGICSFGNILSVCEKLLPFLVSKREKALLVVEYIKMRLKVLESCGINDSYDGRELEYYDKFRKLNKVGAKIEDE